LSLIANARKAMKGAGELCVVTRSAGGVIEVAPSRLGRAVSKRRVTETRLRTRIEYIIVRKPRHVDSSSRRSAITHVRFVSTPPRR
jgi:hypothetical protein